MTLTPYNRRPLPSGYDKGFLDVEHIRIQQAIDAAQTGASGVTAGTYGDATHVPQVTVDGSGRVTGAANVAIAVNATKVVLRTSDLTTTSGVFQTTGLSFPVLAGESWVVRVVLVLSNANGATTNIPFQLTLPTFAHLIASGFGMTSGTTALALKPFAGTTSPVSLTNSWIGFTAAAAPFALMTFDLSIRGLSSNGTVDLQFNSNGGAVVGVRDGSYLVANKV